VTLNQRKSLMPYLYDTVEYYDHQIEGIRKMARMQNALLADDMGLGKSLQALTVAAIDVVRGWCTKMMVVAPVSLKGNWADEIEKFTTFPYIIFGEERTVTNGVLKVKKLGPAERHSQLEEYDKLCARGPAILIINYEQVQPHLKELNQLGFDITIFDEAHYMKNYKSQRTKACLKLTSTRNLLLTGTPLLNQVNELWPLLHKIDPAGYPRYWPFVTRYCVFGGFKDKQIIGVKNERELTERLQSVMIRRMKKDVLDLPDVQYIDRKVDLKPEQRKVYDKLLQDLILERSDGTEDEIDNALTKFLRLKQICGTTLPFTGEDHSSKLDLAVSDAIEVLLNKNKLVVFTQFRDVKEAFCSRMDSIAPDFDIWELDGDVPTHERQGVVRAWSQHREPAMLVCMLQVAGVGLNMTAARHGFFIDELFVPGLNQQAVDRMHRIGADTTQPVQINRYICRNTIESRIQQILRTKKKLFGSIVDRSDFKRKLLQALMEKEDD
jgi:SNF2 family DNA or RNA helicase